ncbi:MAG: dihydroxyacetone kinase subunit L [Candidatus Moduliflexus flocculans]|nr:dihydroxyacetone kinase subunit L [Candidatus Moduliflexus flocculans]
MKIRYLDGKRLYYAFLAGRPGRHPRPGPTSTRSTSSRCRIPTRGPTWPRPCGPSPPEARAHRSATDTLGSLADAALAGARGNSGLIFAQFLYGLSQEVRGEHRLTVRRFAESVAPGRPARPPGRPDARRGHDADPAPRLGRGPLRAAPRR